MGTAATGLSRLRVLDRPVASAALSLLIYFILLLLLLDKLGWDASRLIVAGDSFVNEQTAPPSLWVNRNSHGYDGQFYYRLALDPFTDKQLDFGISIDNPGYRHQRLLLPLLARCIACGHPQHTAWAILLVNFLCIGMIGWVGGAAARMAGGHALFGAAAALYPGLILALARSLTEVLEVSLLAVALLLVVRRNHLAAALALALAVLARETAIIAVAALFIAWSFQAVQRRRADMSQWCLFVLPGAAFVLWQSWLYFNWGTAPALSTPGRALVAPFSAFWPFLHSTLEFRSSYQVVWFIECLYLCVLGLAAAAHQLNARIPLQFRWTWLCYAALAVSLPRTVWVEDWSYLRVLSEFGVIGVLLLMYAGSWARVLIFTATAGCWLALAYHVLFYR